MRVGITGATGMVGTALAVRLQSTGHEVVAISRRPGPGRVQWNPERHEIDPGALQSLDAVVNLAGENLAGGRWTAHRKQLLCQSRIPLTRWLSELLARSAPRLRVLVSVSAVGIYGDRGDDLLDEASSHGSDFLATLAEDWEAAAQPARAAGIRVVHPRFGMILSPTGGALAKMLPPFRLGLGGPFGNGRQWISWMALDDAVEAMLFALMNDKVEGPVNFTSDQPVRNADFARELGRALGRPAVIPVPAMALRLIFGELADVALLASQRMVQSRLTGAGFMLRHRTLADALESMMHRG